MKLTSTHQTETDLTAAAAIIDPAIKSDREYLKECIERNRAKVGDAWDLYESLGDVHFAVARSARIAGYAKYFPRTYSPSTEPLELTKQITQGIYSRFGGTRGLTARYYSCMKIPGDAYLIRMKDEDKEWDGYHFASADELEFDETNRENIKWITMPAVRATTSNNGFSGPSSNGRGRDRRVKSLSPDQFLGRVWVPGMRYVDMPDTPMVALRDECETLRVLTETIKARLHSRLAMAGIVYIPSEVKTAQSVFTTQASTPAAGGDTDTILNDVLKVMELNLTNRDDKRSAIPMVLRGPGQHGEQLRHFTLDLDIFENDLRMRQALVMQILQGLDVQRVATEGIEVSNHWAAWAISDEERRITVQPDIEMMCWAMTVMILHPQMRAARIPEDVIADHYIGFDLSGSAVRSNAQEDVRQLRDRGLVNGSAARAASGVGEEDALEGDEYVRWVGEKAKNPYFMLWGTDQFDKVDWEAANAAIGKRSSGPLPESDAEEPEAGPGVGNPGSPDDIDSDAPRVDRPD